MGEFLTLGENQGKKDYGYVAKIKNGGSVYDIVNIEYEIVLEGDEEISDGNWDKIVGDIVVYDMKDVYNDNREPTTLDSSFDWTNYIVFVFRATRDNGATTEIEVKYIEDGVFSPPKKEEKKDDEVTEIVLKAEKVSGDDNKYNLFFKFPTKNNIDKISNFDIKFNKAVEDFEVENHYIQAPYGQNKIIADNKIFLFNKKLEGIVHNIGTVSIKNDTKIGDYIGYIKISTLDSNSNRTIHKNILFQS